MEVMRREAIKKTGIRGLQSLVNSFNGLYPGETLGHFVEGVDVRFQVEVMRSGERSRKRKRKELLKMWCLNSLKRT